MRTIHRATRTTRATRTAGRLAQAGALSLAAATLLPTLGAAPASASDREVRTQGSCSRTSDWKLKVKQDDGRLEVEAEVDSNVAGQTWTWRISDNGTRVAHGQATTRGPSGSFSVGRRIADRAGADRVTLRATHADEVCTGAATL